MLNCPAATLTIRCLGTADSNDAVRVSNKEESTRGCGDVEMALAVRQPAPRKRRVIILRIRVTHFRNPDGGLNRYRVADDEPVAVRRRSRSEGELPKEDLTSDARPHDVDWHLSQRFPESCLGPQRIATSGEPLAFGCFQRNANRPPKRNAPSQDELLGAEETDISCIRVASTAPSRDAQREDTRKPRLIKDFSDVRISAA